MRARHPATKVTGGSISGVSTPRPSSLGAGELYALIADAAMTAAPQFVALHAAIRKLAGIADNLVVNRQRFEVCARRRDFA